MAPKRSSKQKVIQSESEDEIDARIPTGEDGDGADHGFSDSELTPPPPASQEIRSNQPTKQRSKEVASAANDKTNDKTLKVVREPDNEDQAATSKPKGKANAGAAKAKGKGRKSTSSSVVASQRPSPAVDTDLHAGPSTSTPAEGSTSPSKKITLKLNVLSSNSARQTPNRVASPESGIGVDPSPEPEPDMDTAAVSQSKKRGKEKKAKSSASTPVAAEDGPRPNKKRKSVSLETSANTPQGEEEADEEGNGPGAGAVKKVKLSLKAQPGDGSRPGSAKDKEPKAKKVKKEDVPAEQEDTGDSLKVKLPAKVKGKAKRPVDVQGEQELAAGVELEEEQKVVKPKKNAKRIAEEDDAISAEAGSKGSPTKTEQALPEKVSATEIPPARSLENKNVRRTDSSPERAVQTKSSPPRIAKSLKSKKPRQSEPAPNESDSDGVPLKTITGPADKVKVNKEKEGGLARSNSTPNLANNASEGSTQKKPLLKKKPAPRPAGAGGTPVQPSKPAASGMSLLGNTLALLQGTGTTTGTPKGKDGKKDKEVKKETPRPVRKGGWAEDWVLTAEQRKEYEAHRAEREAERKKRDQWRVDPVNLQEAKDTYRVDSMQSRTIGVPGSMGIRTEGMASQAIRSVLGF
ncbi:hypothetical protein IAU59_002176 [Kwoniella sp. CBS 9459]